MLDAVKIGRPRISAENIESVRQAFIRSPMKSIRTAARQLELPPTTVHKVLRKRLRLYAYKVQMLQRLQPNDKPKRKELMRICCNERGRKSNIVLMCFAWLMLPI